MSCQIVLKLTRVVFRSLEDAAARLQGYLASSSSPQSGWDVFNYALPVAYNTRTNLMFTCVSSPESHFQFHSSVIRSQKSHGVFESLFCRSVSVLQPMLQLADVDTSNPQGLVDIELSLGSSLFDAMAHLVALSSVSLHDVIENHIGPSPIQHRTEYVECGMNASVSSEGLFVGRVTETRKLNRCMEPVFQGVGEHCVLALVHGIPGSGKSRLAKRQLEILQRQRSDYVVYRHIVQGRGRGAARDGLHQMGLALAAQLNVGTAASVDDVLPLLRKFLQNQRFVILADDADAEALDELLRHVPPSSKPCALVFTSQFGSQMTGILEALRSQALPFQFSLSSDTNIELDKFDPETAVELVAKMCLGLQSYDTFQELDRVCDPFTPAPPPLAQTDRKFCFFWSIRIWLRDVLRRDMDYLPLAVQAFSVWLRQEAERVEANAANMIRRWSTALDGDFVGEVSSGHRAINATVLLALHNIGSRYSELDEACRQVLGLLALCPPVNVPWSLFDGVSLVSAMGQACKVRSDDGSGGVVLEDAVIASDAVDGDRVQIQVLGKKPRQQVPHSSVTFGPQIIGMIAKDGRYRVQLLTPQPSMRGSTVEVTGQSLEFVSPVGEPCQVEKTDADGERVVLHAVVASDKIVKGGESVCVQLPDGKKEFVPRSSVSFGAHVTEMAVQEGRLVLQLQKLQPAGGAISITIGPRYRDKAKRGKRALLVSNYIVNERIRVRLRDGSDAHEILLDMQHAELPHNLRIAGRQLVLQPAAPALPSPPPSQTGRVLQYHRANPLKDDPANDTVSVVFGCETGACCTAATCA